MLGQNIPLIGFCCDDSYEESIELKMDLTEENDDEESEKQCSNNCDSICCGQLMTVYNYLVDSSSLTSDQDIADSKYSFQYSFTYSKGIWHPPSA